MTSRPTKGPDITTLIINPAPENEAPRLAYHDRVRVPDGRVGEVVGFYKRSVASVLVSFGPGVAAEFPMTDVEAI